MASRSKKKRMAREMANQVEKQIGGHVVGVRHEETRPAQLTPEIVAKFTNEDVKALVNSFCASVEFQNQTDRMAMQEHYNLQRAGQNKGMIAILSMFGITLGSLFLTGKFEPKYIIICFIIASSVYFVPGIFNAVSGMIISFRMKFKSPENK